MAGIGGLAALALSDYKPLSDAELKKLRTDIVRDKLCTAIGKSVYYYQGLLRIIKDLIHLHFFRKGLSSEAFDALLHETTDKAIFNIFSKIYSHKMKGILGEIESVRNNIMHSNYMVSEHSVMSEKPRLDKTETNNNILKKDMNLNTDIIMAFTGILSDAMDLVNKIHLSEFKQNIDKKKESEHITTDSESLKLKIRELKSSISKVNKDKSPYDDLVKTMMYRI